MENTKIILKKINNLEKIVSKYTKNQMQENTIKFIKEVENGKKLEEILPEAFAMVREAVKRVTGKRLYDVQILGGYYLHQGRIAEIKAGEGKTLIESLPAYLNALTKKGVHIITTNNYLAKRDFNEVGKVLEYLGLSVGLIYQGMENKKRKEEYKKDVVYGVNTEFGFDYLRDNITKDIKDVVQRELNYAIIDEADSILLDEAQTPMIIARKQKNINIEEYIKAKEFVKKLNGRKIIKEEPKNKKQMKENEKFDYIVDETYKTVELTEKGIAKAEKEYKIENFFDAKNYKYINYIRQALRAKELLKKDVDYIIENGEIKLVDKYTGRVMPGKRFVKGLHEAIEAKENLEIQGESKLIASITVQNYFKMYKKLSGMTGTAKASEKEFNIVYNLDVVTVPLNKKSRRKDRKDVIFKNSEEKNSEIIKEVEKSIKKGQPVLIGTTSIEESENISKLLNEKNISHKILNAKNDEEEAEIVKEAGDIGKVTVSTNMAGRGTNIILGGKKKIRKKEVLNAGGLKVIGTNKHESSRIDEQLRGRSGRQGDIGESIFILSLEDELIKIYGNEKKIKKCNKCHIKRLRNHLLANEFKKATKKAENRNYTIRKRLVYYDEVLDSQRNVIYKDRREVIKGNLDYIIKNFIKYFCNIIVKKENETDIKIIDSLQKQEKIIINEENLVELQNRIYSKYVNKKYDIGEEKFETKVKNELLEIIDSNWREHIETMEDLKMNMELRIYGRT